MLIKLCGAYITRSLQFQNMHLNAELQKLCLVVKRETDVTRSRITLFFKTFFWKVVNIVRMNTDTTTKTFMEAKNTIKKEEDQKKSRQFK